MIRRVLPGLAIVTAWLAATVLGISGAAFRTPAGRRVVVDWGLQTANNWLLGSLTVGEVGGSFFRGLEIRDFAVLSEDGSPVLSADRVAIRYGIRDLLRGHIVFGSLRLEGPEMHLVQDQSGAPLNLVQLIPKGEGDGGPGPLVAFGDVNISDGRVVVMTPAPTDGGAVFERVAGPHVDLQVRRFEGLEGELAYLRVASPEPDSPILAEFDRLRAEITDPALSLQDLRGTVQLWGDSVRLDLADVTLPNTDGEVEGLVWWTDGPLLFDLRGRASPGLMDDIQGLVPGLPAGLSGNARFTVTSRGAEVIAFTCRELDLRGREGGEMRGQLGMVLGPGDRWAFTETDLDFVQFDLEYFRGFLDTLPFVGRLSGDVAADGPAELLALTVDATFFDHLVDDRPVSSVLGEGRVSLVDGDFIFERFTVEQADIALASVRRLVPSVIVMGRLWAEGTLDGSWLDATFEGDLHYTDPPLAETAARGWVRLDSRGDTVGMWGELTLDSLRLESFHSSFEAFDLQGAWGGVVHLSGYMDSLSFDVALEGPAGAVSGEGALFALEQARGVHGVRVEVVNLDMASLSPALPETRLDGRLSGAGGDRSAVDFQLDGEASLTRSVVEGIGIARASTRFSVDNARVGFDSVHILGYAFEVSAAGAIARDGDGQDTLTFVAVVDSVGGLEPLLAEWLGSVEASEVASRPSGTAGASGRLVGSLSAYQLYADFDLTEVRRGDLYVSRSGGTATWVSATETLRLDGSADSLRFGRLALGGVQLQLHGRPDSFQWFGRSRHGFGAWLGRGELVLDSSSIVAIDTLMLSLESGLWLADSRAAVVMDDSGLTFVDVNFRNQHGPGQVSFGGRWPFEGEGRLDGSVDGFTVADVLVLALENPDVASGELNGTVRLRGSARAPIIEVNLALQDGRYRDFRTPYTQGILQYRDRRLTGDVELWRLSEQILKVTAELPLDLALSGADGRRLPGPISVRAQADSADLALFEAITPAVEDLVGTLDADFGIEGTWEDPELAGAISVRGGAATLPALGVRHEELNGSLVLSGDTITVRDLSLRSGTGTARVEGFVRLEELTRPILSLGIVARDLAALDIPDFLTLTVSGDVDLNGPMYEASLTGQGTATRGVLYFADLLRKDIINLEDTLFAEFVDTSLIRQQGLGAQVHSRFLDSLRIDSLRLEIGDEFWMRSRDANVQLGGAVFVNKVRDEYRLTGIMEARRGTYRLQLGFGNSREFTVTGGEIRYLGTPDLNADLDIDAEHEVRTTLGEDLRVFVNIGGTLYDPRLSLTSEMVTASGGGRGLALSEPEIIGYLLFGAPTLRAGASQGGFESRLVTQQVFGALSGQIEYSLITDMGVPLDYLQIRPTTSLGGLSGFQAAFGKQFQVLGTTAFLSASPHFCSREAFRLEGVGAGLEFRLNRQWLVSASVDPLRSCETGTTWTATNYQFGADLFWEKRF